MAWLNYHHLLYFWMTAREGSVARACKLLRLAQPTVSAQIRSLENSMGVKLFRREGRHLVLTAEGQHVFRYAADIFTLGEELQRSVGPGAVEGPAGTLVVGIDNAVPKRVAQMLLEPALDGQTLLRCHEDTPQNLLERLKTHVLDLVITDAPLGHLLGGKGVSHRLGGSRVGMFAAVEHVDALKEKFPRSLHGHPMLLPARGLTLRTLVDGWLHNEGVAPRVVAEFDDSALMKAFAHGPRVFPACTVMAPQLLAHLGADLVGVLPQVRQEFFAVTNQRQARHPALARITRAAHQELLGPT
jgi:LysR family transcriptional activator of nhaA